MTETSKTHVLITKAELTALTQHARALVDAVQFDESGIMVAGQWRGGSGGLLSRDTLRVADQLRTKLDAFEARGLET